MTCVIAIKESGRIFMGCDSLATQGNGCLTRKDPKIYKNGPFMFGFTTSYRMGQILGHSLEVPNQEKKQSVQEFMATTFIDSVRHSLKDKGFLTTCNGNEEGGEFIVSYKKKIFVVYSDFQVAEVSSSFVAIGCGQDMALGSLFSTGGFEPKSRIIMALKAAAEFSNGVRRPFIVKEHCL